jgi:Domain of unknown function (DUF4430)
VLRRLLVVLGGGLAAAVFVSPALAVDVKVRVEGVKVSIFGRSEPRLAPVTGTFSPPEGPDITVSGSTPLGALERASRRAEFFYRVQSTSFGPYVDRIGRRAATGSSGWVYKVDHVSPPVGADSYKLKKGDKVLWYWATFGPAGGPKTLDLARAGAGCFRAFAYNDAGERSRPGNVVFVRNGRREVVSESGRYCPPARWESLRAKKQGMVRSELARS